MLKMILIAILPFLVLFGNSGTESVLTGLNEHAPQKMTSGTLEKMIIGSGNASMDLNLGNYSGARAGSRNAGATSARFALERDSFFTVLVLNGELRGPLPSAMPLVPQDTVAMPAKLAASYKQLVVESLPWGGQYELAVRDRQSGFIFFNIEGHEYGFDADQSRLTISNGRMLLSPEFAAELGRPSDAGALVGQINIAATMRPIEVSQIEDGQVVADSLPATETGTTPGPDVVVGDLTGLAQFGSSAGTQVGLAVGTDSCNFGTIDLNWFANPANDHPVIPQNMYRMSGGTTNDQTFEQIGQSSVKHAFTALTQNLCALGCNGTGGTRLGSGCSDPYSASLNSGPSLGSRAWINPFTGFYPRNDSATPNNNHAAHTHTGPSHRILTEISDLSTTQNPGASYFAEAQYVTPHEYAWCQANPGQCNMFNNVSYRKYNVSGTGSPFAFSPAAATVRSKRAVSAWPGATMVDFRPDPVNDGVGSVSYKVTNPSPGVWHYEYAIFNENIDRAIQSFAVPAGNGVTISNIGFHAPPQHPGWAADGSVGDAGFSNTPWSSVTSGGTLTWATQTFAQNPNANAIRWGTLYNFRFDSNRPPQNMNATIGFFKTGSPITVQVQGPAPAVAAFASISGRVVNQQGMGVRGAIVSVSDGGTGLRRSAITSPFGYYSFENLPTATNYTVAVISKTMSFTSQNVTLNDNLTEINFTALP